MRLRSTPINLVDTPSLRPKVYKEHPSFTCPRCYLRSYDPRDIAEKVCVNCMQSFGGTLQRITMPPRIWDQGHPRFRGGR